MYYDSLSFEKFPAAYCASMASFFVYTHNIKESDKICNHGDLKLLSDGLGDKLCNGTVITCIVLETYK